MQTSFQWAQALEGNIQEWIHEGFSRHSDWSAQVLNIESNSGFTRIQDSWGPRLISKSGEGQSTSVATRQLGYETIAGNQIFKQSMMVTEEYDSRGQYDSIKREAEDLGKATIETLNIFAAQPFIEGLILSL